MRHDKQRACELRLQGKSYGEICKELCIPSKGTLSVWFKDLVLTKGAERKLQRNQELAMRRGLIAFNQKRSARVQLENQEVFAEGINKIGQLTRREILLVSAALYWGEGTKSAGDGRSIMAVLTNSDPLMIQFYLRFLREIIEVPKEKIRVQIILHDSTSPKAAKKYWRRVTGIVQDAFSVTVQVSRASKRFRSKRSLPYGTLQIRVHDRKLFFKIKGMIHGLTLACKL